MRRLTLLVLPFLVVSAFVLGACGDDDNAGDEETLSLESYFIEVSSLLENYQSGNADAFSVLSDSQDLDELKSAFNVLPGNLSDFLDGMQDLATPPEAEGPESDVIAAGEALETELDQANEEAQAAESVDAFLQAADSAELKDLSDAFAATCEPMQELATDNGVEDELGCPE